MKKIDIKNRSLLTLLDYSSREIEYLLDLAFDLKKEKSDKKNQQRLYGKNIVLVFEKASTRTRCAFEVAAFDEGARVTYLTNSQLGEKESIADTARVLGRYYEGIGFRGFAQKTAEDLTAYSKIPVWNGLTDDFHPTQALADIMTVREKIGRDLSERKIVFVGDCRNNVANSLMIISAKLGLKLSLVCPFELRPASNLFSRVLKLAAASGGRVDIAHDPLVGVANADAIFTDMWISMGEEEEIAKRINLLRGFQVNEEMMAATGKPETIFLHCLPACHDTQTQIGKKVMDIFGLPSMEVSDEVFNSSNSAVFDQAENRLHTIKAAMIASIGNP